MLSAEAVRTRVMRAFLAEEMRAVKKRAVKGKQGWRAMDED